MMVPAVRIAGAAFAVAVAGTVAAATARMRFDWISPETGSEWFFVPMDYLP